MSAGRVQSVAVRLIVEREEEIKNFKSESFYRVNGLFHTAGNAVLRAELGKRLHDIEEARQFLSDCNGRYIQGRCCHGKTREQVARPSVHDIDSSAGSCAKTRFHRVADHDGGAAAL